VSDDGRREWVAANRDRFTELLIPRAFLAASAVADEPDAPEELNARLDTLGGRPVAGNCVRVDWPVDLLQPLANYAEDCARAWNTSRIWRTAHIAAGALAEHARHAAEQEA
jgi:hypothetical protein